MPDHTDEGEVVPVGGTAVTASPPAVAPRPQKRAPARAARPEHTQPGVQVDDLAEDAEPDPGDGLGADDPRATRILSVEALAGPARFELLVTAGPARGARFALTGGAHTVGRSAQCDCSILDEAVSRRHFELNVDHGSVSLRDLGSGNGTLVNGERADEVTLVHGDVLQIGDSTLEFREKGRAPVSQARRQAAGQPTVQRMQAAGGAPGANRRKQMLLATAAVFAMLMVFLALLKIKAQRQQIAGSVAAFDHGRQELDQGDADAALQDFQRALPFYPDPSAVQEKIQAANVISDGNRSLVHARGLEDQKDFDGARKVLDGVPHNDYLDQQVKTLRDEIDKREADAKKEELVRGATQIDPTTAAEAHEYYVRGKQERGKSLDAADLDLGRAFDMLSAKGASGTEFEQLKLDYLEVLKQIYARYKRSNPARAELAFAKANQILPDAISTAAPPSPALPEEPKVKRSKHVKPPRRRATYTPPSSRHAGASTSPAGSGSGGHYNESRAEELDDEGDALLGQNPDAAKDKYRQALKLAPPDSDAAQRARAGLGD